jgi:abortive infection bacteriophage resistance protein
MKEYGILYARVVAPEGNKLRWLSHCGLSVDILPKDLKKELLSLVNRINTEYKDVIVVPVDKKIIPGCVTKPESIDEVAKSIYDGMNQMIEKLTGEKNTIRLVYGVGDLDEDWIENNTKSAHEIGNFPIMVKIGHFFDFGPDGKKSGTFCYEPGLFKV